jgi:hypothetical protein
LDAVNKIVFGFAKILLGKSITGGSIGGGVALTGGSSGTAVVAGIAIAAIGAAAGAVVAAEGFTEIIEGSMSLMKSNGNDYTRRENEAKQNEGDQIKKTAQRNKIDQNEFGNFVEGEKKCCRSTKFTKLYLEGITRFSY